jgi:hypothetical protein
MRKKQVVKIAKDLQVCGGENGNILGAYYDDFNVCENRR